MTDIDKIQPDLPHVVIGPVISSGNAVVVNKCEECPHAIWDFEEYYGTTRKQWFGEGCDLDAEPEDCEEEE